MRQFVSKARLPLIDGKIFVGLVFVISGAVVAWGGAAHVKELWSKVSQFFPISLPNDISQRTLVSFPLIFTELISAVSSLCAVLVGAMWFFSGMGEIFRSLKPHAEPSDFRHPELVTETVRTGEAQYWRTSSLGTRLLGRIWGRARYVSPISYEFFGKIFRSSLKTLMLCGVIALVFYFWRILPLLMKRYLQLSVDLAVPSPTPMYFLIGTVLLLNVLIMVSLFPIRKRQFFRREETLAVRGRGDPQVFFALLEEGCRLLTPAGASSRAPIRLMSDNESNLRATLVENFPQSVGSVARPAGFLCLPLIFFPLTMGFSRLVHFQRSVSEMPYQVFLQFHALDYVVEVLFALGLILVGLYFAEWARKLFDVRKYRSDLILCHSVQQFDPAKGSEIAATQGKLEWRLMDGVDNSFAGWAKDPHSTKSFLVKVFWAEVHSESASPLSQRYLIQMAENGDLDRSMWRILKLPFFVNFETEGRHVGADRG